MALNKDQVAALQNVYDNGILDHDDKARQALAQVLADAK
ncbi:hypothetical protein FT12353_06630 [Fructobacillus tropaeoli]|nr:hypothetical protein FEFB_01890 [Fructobacillus sp. EFB-N1]CAK1221848.1 hypothetical protein R55250_KEHBDPNM_00136 [Fructobacillus sp. LMG 32999]CAK1228018.1 hypothetical protein R55227_BLOPHJLP_00283 [Fructobacillus tropaeoli]CAK1229861.1 hypothetical protein R82641_BJNNKPBH_00249 [Fructobacillus cardui]CAK1222046.1 hypothetical protein R53718_MFFEMHAI_00137 [Fructobacillus sp. LMG 32999]